MLRIIEKLSTRWKVFAGGREAGCTVSETLSTEELQSQAEQFTAKFIEAIENLCPEVYRKGLVNNLTFAVEKRSTERNYAHYVLQALESALNNGDWNRTDLTGLPDTEKSFVKALTNFQGFMQAATLVQVDVVIQKLRAELPGLKDMPQSSAETLSL